VEAAAHPRRRPRARRPGVLEQRRFLAPALIAPAVLFIALLVGGPLVLAIYLSFTGATAGQLTADWIGLENYRRAWADPIFRDAFKNTFLFTFVSQAFVIVGAGVLAHFLMKDFRGKWILRMLILLPWAAPVALTSLGWLWIFDSQFSVVNWVAWKLGLIEFVTDWQWIGEETRAMAAIITAHAWRMLPFATVIMIAGLASIPKEVDDAAAVDGAVGLKKLWHVTLPLQLPIATIAVLFGIVFTATDMAVVKILTNGGPFNSTQMLTTWAYATGVESQSLGAGAAVSLFMLPILAGVTILMLLFAKRVEVT
jgi:multiple sugar transport system permease protein